MNVYVLLMGVLSFAVGAYSAPPTQTKQGTRPPNVQKVKVSHWEWQRTKLCTGYRLNYLDNLSTCGRMVPIAYPQQVEFMTSFSECPITDTVLSDWRGISNWDSCFRNKTPMCAALPADPTKVWCFMRHTNGTVLRYLGRAESREINPWYRDDYRIASHTVRFAKQGIPHPFERAFLHYFGKSIDKALIEWADRDERASYELLCALPKKSPSRVEAIAEKSAKRG